MPFARRKITGEQLAGNDPCRSGRICNLLPALLMTVVIMTTSGLSARSQVFINDELKISPLEEGVWVVEKADNSTMYIIEGREKAMLIDTGTSSRDLDKVVREITQKPLYVVITHVHPDHAGSIGYFDGIYLHPGDTILLDGSYSGKLNFLMDGDLFDLGGRHLEVRHMPGHTPGSIVLLERERGTCYSGDAFGSGSVWLQLRPFSPIRFYIDSLEKMEGFMDQGIEKIYCGHYPHVKGPLYREYITAMKELAGLIYDGTPPDPQPYSIKVSIGSDNPVIATKGGVSIVYDPDKIK